MAGDVEPVRRRFGQRERQCDGGEIRDAHVNRDDAVAHRAGRDQSRRAVHDDFAGPGAPRAAQQLSDAARAVATLLDLAAIGVVDAIENLCAGATRRCQHQRLIEADAGMPIRQCTQLRCVRDRALVRRIEDDEVVAEAMHFREVQSHGCGFNTCAGRCATPRDRARCTDP